MEPTDVLTVPEEDEDVHAQFEPVAVATRSGRVVSKPKHFNDFTATEFATTAMPTS
jgi:hypothetical protein